MLKVKQVLCVILCVSILFTLFGCKSHGSTNDEIIGKWVHEGFEPGNYPGEIEFSTDNELNYDGWSGTYSIDGDRLLCNVGADAYSFDFKISDGTLYLTADNDDTYAYVKESTKEDKNSDSTVEETETSLSDSCDEVLCSETDIDGNKYELVMKNESDFDNKIIKYGVIKNNEWIIPLTTDVPFLDEETGEPIYQAYENNFSYQIDYAYLGSGCFINSLSQGNDETRAGGKCFDAIIYNSSNKKSYKLLSYKDSDNNISYINYFVYVENMDSQQPIIIHQPDEYSKKNGVKSEYEILNLKTMTTSKLKGKFEKIAENSVIDDITPVVEDVFYLEYSDKENYSSTAPTEKAFFDTNGNIKFNLSKYDIVNIDGFQNGQCKFYAMGADNNKYEIVIDKTGKEISKTIAEGTTDN